jgi:hypothetical protein
VLEILGLVGVRSSAQTAPVSVLALALEHWSLTAGMRTQALALLPCCSMDLAVETQLLERPQWSITTAILKDRDHLTALSALLRSILT